MALIPSNRLYSNWPNSGCTIPPQTQTIFQTITSTGDATDRTATINTALSSCPTGQVVLLGPGTFRCNSTVALVNTTGVVLRGSGMDSTILDCRPGSGAAVRIGNTGSDWPWTRDGTTLSGNAAVGDTVINLSSTAAFSVGDRVMFNQDPDTSLPVVCCGNFNFRSQLFETTITAKDASTITIEEPLPQAFTTALTAKVKRLMTDGWATESGIEDLTVMCENGGADTGVQWYNCYKCWFHSVKVTEPDNYNFEAINAVRCTMQKCWTVGQGSTGNNHAGTINGFPGSNAPGAFSCVFQDNIITLAFPSLELNIGSSGNVFAYNFCFDSRADGGGGTTVFGCAIDINHGMHPAFNLIEGNFGPKLQADGYFGSCAHDTIFRNRLTGAMVPSPQSNSLAGCVDLCRFSRNDNVCANVLGTTQAFWTNVIGSGTLVYQITAHNATGPYIYRFGYPNMGGNGYSGTAEPSQGDFWADWGTSPGDGTAGYQERDLDVENTLLLLGNYNLLDEEIPVSEQTAEPIPDSYYLSSKPDWFYGLAWPVEWLKVGSTAADLEDEAQMIPAGYRYYNNGDDPPISLAELNVTTLNATTMTIG